MRPKKSLGQNFLRDQAVIQRIIESLRLGPNDTVVEIGPGRGALTRQLLAADVKVVAVEIDRDLIPYLENEFTDEPGFSVVHADFLETDLRSLLPAETKPKIVGNLPYYVSTPILQRLIDQSDVFETAVLMFQREVADRLTAKPGTTDRGYITVLAEAAFTIEKILDVPPQAFFPIPKVWSSVIRLLPKDNVAVSPVFRALVSAGFTQKRKTILNNLKGHFENSEATLLSCRIDSKRRAESLTIDEWELLSTLIASATR